MLTWTCSAPLSPRYLVCLRRSLLSTNLQQNHVYKILRRPRHPHDAYLGIIHVGASSYYLHRIAMCCIVEQCRTS